MLQRIQSVYLLVSSLLFLLMINNPLAQIITEEGVTLELNYLQLESLQPEVFPGIFTWPLTILLFTVILAGLISIFLFKKRTMQMRLCMFNILLMFGLIGMIYYYARFARLGGLTRDQTLLLWPIVIPFISAILSYLALKAIQKDDALVKSWERLR